VETEQYERKLVAILYADVAGYSRLTGADEAGTHRALSTYLDLFTKAIQWHRGNVVHYAGDAILAEFGMASDALTCAINVQKELQERDQELPEERKVRFRIGVNLGEVIVDRDDIYGEGVNIAARLESLAEPGGVCVSDAVRNAVGGKLPVDYEFMGEQQVKNIEEPVRAYRARLGPGAELFRPSAPPKARPSWLRTAGIAAVIVLIIGGSLALLEPWESREEPASVEHMAFPLPDKPSIAVLPFANMSGDPEQEYFSDGITDDIITDLSKISGLFVISRNSTFTYKDNPVDVRRVAEDLGVRYVLEGSVRRVGDHVRINAQLIDALTGGHLWADRYDHELGDVFALQDQVVDKVVLALAVKLKPREHNRLRREYALTPESYDLFLHARSILLTYTIDKNRLVKARELFDRLIEHAPSFPGGYAGLSHTYSMAVLRGYSPSPLEDASEALKWAQTAWEIDEQFDMSTSAIAYAFQVTGQSDKAIDTLGKMLMSAPSNADAHAQLGRLLIWEGRAAESIDPISTAIRLNPDFGNPYLTYLALADFTLGKYDAAISELKENFDRGGPIDDAGLAVWAAALSELGETVEAATLVDKLFDIYPDFNLRSFWLLRLYVRPEDRNRLTEIFKRAGLPEDRPYTR
jgi:TolB-like protein/class 3 adenylate cyclase/Tfp pilus assembly protein PilF